MAGWSFTGTSGNHALGRGVILTISQFVFLMVSVTLVAGFQFSGDDRPISWQQDAEITDIFFIDSQRGWAVGAEGVLLRTENGGREWQEAGNASANVTEELSLKQKLDAMQQGIHTRSTGIADLRSKSNDDVRFRFESVFFIDENRGWVAGGFEIPYTGHSRGVIMKTLDGGVTWRSIRGIFTPRINQIIFTDARNGWAVGQRGGLLSEGFFFTTDGGETWSGSPNPYVIPDTISGWHNAIGLQDGFVSLSNRGQPVVLKRQQAEISVVQTERDESFKQLAMQDELNGWAVGRRGAVYRTANAGLSWRPAFDLGALIELRSLLTQFDFRTICCTPSRIWFAGNPGSLIFSIERATGAIRTHSTGSPLPINKIFFVDNDHGWAVGPLGLILATADGGDTWQIQRNLHRSLAVMGVAVSALDVPLELTASLAGETDYLIGMILLEDHFSAAVREAFQRVGGSLVDSIAVGDFSIDFADAETAYLEALVKQIRIFRPHLLIANSDFQVIQSPHDNLSGFQFEPESFLKMAIKAAADRNQFSDQIRLAQLEPWTVDRMAYRSLQGSTEFNQSTLLFGAGKSMEDFLALSRGVLGLPLFGSSQIAYHVDTLNGPRQPKSHEMLSGLQQGIRPLAKRKPTDLTRGNRGALDNANRKRQMIDALEKFEIQQDLDWGIWAQEVTRWLAPLDHEIAGLALIKLAETYHRQGKIELASHSLEVLLNRFPDHPFEAAAMLWLARSHASKEYAVVGLNRQLIKKKGIYPVAGPTGQGDKADEIAPMAVSEPVITHQNGQTIVTWAPTVESLKEIKPRRVNSLLEENQGTGIDASKNQAKSSESDRTSGELASYTSSRSDSIGVIASSSGSTESSSDLENPNHDENESDASIHWVDRSKLSNQIYSRLGSKQPDLINRAPWRWLSLHAIKRSFGSHAAEAGWKRLAQAHRDNIRLLPANQLAVPQLRVSSASVDTTSELRWGVFGQAAIGELEIQQNNNGKANSPRVHCRLAEQRPTLDGRFDDPVWNRLSEQGNENSITEFSDGWLMMAYDAEFLYIAIGCQKLAHQFYRTDLAKRTRNPDLSSRDRVQFAFDIDRDYATSFQFTVDHRGWGAENLNGAEGWNPTWYIAQAEDDQYWNVEIAIPIDELADSPIKAGEVWAISINRYDRDDQPRWDPVGRRGDAAKGLHGIFYNLAPQPEAFRLLQFD